MQKTNRFGRFLTALLVGWFLVNSPAGGFCCQSVVSVSCYIGTSIVSVFNPTVRGDLKQINYNPFNTNESKVIASQSVSFYKGVPVFRANINRSGSFCAIILSKHNSKEDDIKHEYGHNVQQMVIGPIDFLITIGIPSAFQLSNREYYSRPWELSADIFGGVSGREHSSKDINKSRAYLVVAAFGGSFAYFFLIGEI